MCVNRSDRHPLPEGIDPVVDMKVVKYSLLTALDMIPLDLYRLAEQTIQHLLESCDHPAQRELRASMTMCTSSRLAALRNHPALTSRTAMLETAFEKEGVYVYTSVRYTVRNEIK